ncbi:hypothetical protein QYF36_018868 [Acer negundo]|nr:hypothetical protein QYF36_018868 [Acer negundo]
MAQRYGHNALSDEESDNLFVEQIAHTQFPKRFRMPAIEQYKETRDSKEHVRRFRNIMAQYASNEGLIDHIESLIRDGNLKDFTLRGDKHGGRQDNQGGGQEKKSPRKNSLGVAINTIFGGPYSGRSNRERMSEVREVMKESSTEKRLGTISCATKGNQGCGIKIAGNREAVGEIRHCTLSKNNSIRLRSCRYLQPAIQRTTRPTIPKQGSSSHIDIRVESKILNRIWDLGAKGITRNGSSS